MDYRHVASPLGMLLLAGTADVLQLIAFPEGRMARTADAGWREDTAAFAEAARQLDEYFAGERREFSCAIAPAGTAFQLQVLAALRAIPYGETRSYAQVATALGRPRAMRAVGAANGRNPLPIVIPCHRVIGADGSLTGFGGGIAAKRFLLDLERHASLPQASPP